MFNTLKNLFAQDELEIVGVRKATRGRKSLTKTQKVRNLFEKGEAVSWKTLRNKFDLTSPAQMVGKLRNEGMMIYENRSSNGVSYRVGTPSKAIIAAGINAVYGKQGYAA